ncbi:MAG: ABC transporter ATP-binding protein/permease [Acholeplasmataceae bacterium]|nr:ABC transporter ATP-binding protein/permease [Acholeplasmataceae bacterium]
MIFGKHINKYYLKYSYFFILGIIALVFVDIFQLRIPEIIGEIVDYIKESKLTMELLNGYVKEFIIVIAVMFIGRFTWRITIFGNGARIEADLRRDLFKKCEQLGQTFYQNNKVGSVMALYTNDIQTMREVFGSGILMMVDATVLGILSFVKMLRMDVQLTLVASVPLVLLAILGLFVGKYMEKKYEIRQQAYANLSDFSQESFSGLSVIKAFLKETEELRRFSKINKENMDKNIEFEKLSMLVNNLLFGIFIGSIFIVLYILGSILILHKKFEVGTLTTFVAYFDTLIWPMMAIANLINLHSQGKASLKRLNEVFNYEKEIKDSEDVIKDHQIKGKITFNNLSFTYPNSDREVLSNISLTIPQGYNIGLIGRTGCGKTTLVELLMRIYNVKENEILIDDIDIMKLPVKDVRNAISYVPQDNFLFSDTIKNNISFSSNEVDENEVIKASINSDVDSNIKDFKEGYDTVLGERGVTVSGGQKQRISIARALLKNSQILILDDSVSAVDTKTEETIINNLKNIRKNKTTILIAHRISTVKKMDRIIVMDEGKVIGYGTHEELEKNCKEYQNMVHLQRLEDEIGDDNE